MKGGGRSSHHTHNRQWQIHSSNYSSQPYAGHWRLSIERDHLTKGHLQLFNFVLFSKPDTFCAEMRGVFPLKTTFSKRKYEFKIEI